MSFVLVCAQRNIDARVGHMRVGPQSTIHFHLRFSHSTSSFARRLSSFSSAPPPILRSSYAFYGRVCAFYRSPHRTCTHNGTRTLRASGTITFSLCSTRGLTSFMFYSHVILIETSCDCQQILDRMHCARNGEGGGCTVYLRDHTQYKMRTFHFTRIAANSLNHFRQHFLQFSIAILMVLESISNGILCRSRQLYMPNVNREWCERSARARKYLLTAVLLQTCGNYGLISC